MGINKLCDWTTIINSKGCIFIKCAVFLHAETARFGETHLRDALERSEGKLLVASLYLYKTIIKIKTIKVHPQGCNYYI